MGHVYARHNFTVADWDEGRMPFSAADYSRLKFGSDAVARRYGEELADGFFAAHSDALLLNAAVVIPSPYNYVRNAATIMTGHFVNRLNHLLVGANGEHVDYSIIHRKVSYTHDYGFMSGAQRKSLLAGDQFYLNAQFYEGKTLIFIDDIRITGTHEDRLRGVIDGYHRLRGNTVFYLYYAMMQHECRPDVEAALNFAGIKTLAEYLDLAKEPGHHVIVRPIKFLLSRPADEFLSFLAGCEPALAQEIYAGCLGEGYYRIPDYQSNFLALKDRVMATGRVEDRILETIG